jgi:hypothetical protein
MKRGRKVTAAFAELEKVKRIFKTLRELRDELPCGSAERKQVQAECDRAQAAYNAAHKVFEAARERQDERRMHSLAHTGSHAAVAALFRLEQWRELEAARQAELSSLRFQLWREQKQIDDAFQAMTDAQNELRAFWKRYKAIPFGKEDLECLMAWQDIEDAQRIYDACRHAFDAARKSYDDRRMKIQWQQRQMKKNREKMETCREENGYPA